jgi:hypothetical protein
MSVTLPLLWAMAFGVGAGAGHLSGGRLSNLARHRLRMVIVPWVAFALQALDLESEPVHDFFHDTLHVPTLVVIYALVFVWVLVNLPGRSMALTLAGCMVLLGGLGNAAVIAANGRMPGSYGAAVAAGVPEHLLASVSSSPKLTWSDERTRLAWLGDNIPFRLARLAVSPGDIVLMTGVVLVVAAGMRPRVRTGPTPTDAAEVVSP